MRRSLAALSLRARVQLGRALEAFHPTPCRACPETEGGPLCLGCQATLTEPGPRLEALARPDLLLFSLGLYQGPLRRALLDLKSQPNPLLGWTLLEVFSRGFDPSWARELGVEALTGPPRSPGSSPSHPLALLRAWLPKLWGLPWLDLFEHRGGGTKTRSLGEGLRPLHLKQTIGLRTDSKRPQGPRRLLLVDDLVTTGSTLSHLVELLSPKGFGVLAAVSYARVPRKRKLPQDQSSAGAPGSVRGQKNFPKSARFRSTKTRGRSGALA